MADNQPMTNDENLRIGEEQLRGLAAARRLHWEMMTDEDRIAFVDDLIHEDRPTSPRNDQLPDSTYSRRCWFTFPSRNQVEQPIIWQMSRKFPDVAFDIRQASCKMSWHHGRPLSGKETVKAWRMSNATSGICGTFAR